MTILKEDSYAPIREAKSRFPGLKIATHYDSGHLIITGPPLTAHPEIQLYTDEAFPPHIHLTARGNPGIAPYVHAVITPGQDQGAVSYLSAGRFSPEEPVFQIALTAAQLAALSMANETASLIFQKIQEPWPATLRCNKDLIFLATQHSSVEEISGFTYMAELIARHFNLSV